MEVGDIAEHGDGHFVGRARELERLSRWLESQSRLVQIQGISGVGKSWLVEELISRSPHREAQFAVIDFQAPNQRDPVGFLGALAKQLGKHHFAGFFEAVRDISVKIESSIRVAAPVNVTMLGNSFHGPVGDISGVKLQNIQLNVPSEELYLLREGRVRAATEKFIEGLGQIQATPVVVLDSFEMICRQNPGDPDPMFQWLWNELISPAHLNRVPMRFVLVSQRDVTSTRMSAELRQDLMRFRLDSFGEDDARAYLARHCRGNITEQQTLDVMALTQRNPLCLSLLAELLNESRVDVREELLAFPRRATTSLITGFLVGRILENASEWQARILRLAAVPRTCGYRVMTALMGDSEQARVGYDRLKNFAFFAPSRDGGSRIHDLVRELLVHAFRDEDPDGYREANARLAALFDGDRAAICEFVYHTVRADPRTIAVVAARFARSALRTRNGQIAMGIWEAVNTSPDLNRSSSWYSYCKGVAQLLMGRESDASETFTHLWHASAESTTLKILTASALAVAAQRNGKLQEASEWASRAFDHSSDPTLDNVVVASCLNDMGTILRTQIQLEESLEIYNRAYELGRESATADGRWEAAYASLYRGVIYTGGLSSYGQAEAAFRSAEREFNELGDEMGVVMSIQRIGWLARMKGDLDTALSEHLRARDMLSSGSEPLLLGELSHSTGNVLRQLRRWDEARHYYDECLELFRSARALRHQNLLQKDYGELLVISGKIQRNRSAIAEGVDRLSACVRDKETLGQMRESSPVLSLIGEALTELEQFGAAWTALRRAQEIAVDTGVQINAARALSRQAILGCRDPEISAEETKRLVAATLSIADPGAFHHYRADALAVLALERRRDGRIDEATALLAESLTAAYKYNPLRAEEVLWVFLGGFLAPRALDNTDQTIAFHALDGFSADKGHDAGFQRLTEILNNHTKWQAGH